MPNPTLNPAPVNRPPNRAPEAPERSTSQRMKPADTSRRPLFGKTGAVLGLALLATLLVYGAVKRWRTAQSPANTAAGETPATESTLPTEAAATATDAGASSVTTIAPPPQQPATTAATTTPAPAISTPPGAGSTTAKELLAGLLQINRSGGGPAEKAELIERSFKQLIAQGPAAMPVIREYLSRFQDLDFDPAAAKRLGYPSLRTGLLDALGQIGGSEAGDLLLQTLQKTGDSREIAWLTKGLEKQMPLEQLRPIALAAATDVLSQALAGQWDKRNIAPLFEVLQKYGDQSVAGLLEQSVGKWNYYATLALAGLADGAGIPALIRAAQDPAVQASGNGDFALRPLAQAAMQYPEARTALVDQARLNQIPDTAWTTVAASLGGTVIQYGDQILGRTAPAANWTREEINQRVALLDQLLAVTSSAAGQQALQTARATVLSKTPIKP